MADLTIKPKQTFNPAELIEVWRYRELLYFLAWRDLKVRYKQTLIGGIWAIIQPFTAMVVFSVFFGKLANMPSDGIPYPIFSYSGLLFWQFFSSALTDVSNCLVSNSKMISKVYFPRIILPVSVTLTKFIDFFIASLILVLLMFYYKFSPQWEYILLLPLLLIIAFVVSSGVGLVLASVNARYRDVRYALPFFVQMLLFVTPVIYPSSIAGKYSWIVALNPMAGVIDAARAILLSDRAVDFQQLLISSVMAIVFLIIGLLFLKRLNHMLWTLFSNSEF